MGREHEVKVCRVSIVAPATPTVKHHRMFLSSLDLRSAIYNNMRVVLFYKPSKETEFGFIVETLKRSLSLALVDFYPFAGRLDFKGEESGRPEVDCNDEGVDFVEASIDIAFHDDVELNDFQNKDFFKELVPIWNQSYEAPLLSVQVTAFLGGGFCIGVRFHHVVADAMSFWHFMESWAELSRGIPISKKPHHMMTTVFKREQQNYSTILLTTKQVLTDLSKEAYISCFTRHDNLLPTSKYSGSTGNAVSEENNIQRSLKEETKLQVSTFHFSEKLIKNLKERSGALSSFVAVAAQFWRCVIKARDVGE